MSKNSRDELRDKAIAILKRNDKGNYTVPTHGLYPFQWNWDSCLSALGQYHYDVERAWVEIETLFEHQWPDGMVPHIIFHEHDEGYFPGPGVWDTKRPVSTSGITQPPVAGFALKRLFERSGQVESVKQRATDLVKAIDKWHHWFYECRDPSNEGLVALIHPWESGRDNSVDWDAPFEKVPTDGVGDYQRRDTDHADPSHRPTKDQYDRYIWLLQCFKSKQWDNKVLHEASPFKVVDPGFNAILIRSCADLAELAEQLGLSDIAARNIGWAEKGRGALELLWNENLSQYVCFDRASGQQIESASIGGLLPVFAGVRSDRVDAIVSSINTIASESRYLVASHRPTDPLFDSKRYWRGPLWLIVNYMLIDGLKLSGESGLAQRITEDSLALIAQSGFAEYYDPINGDPCGGDTFTWTAAMVLEFIALG